MSKVEITLQDIFLALKRYLVWICLTTFLFTVGALAYAQFFITPMYSTTVSLCVFANQRTSEEVTSTQMAADPVLPTPMRFCSPANPFWRRSALPWTAPFPLRS